MPVLDPRTPPACVARGATTAASVVSAWASVTPTTQRRSQKQLHDEWEYLGGSELETLLQSGAIALLDAAWLVELAESGKRIERRQDLPKEAFLSLDDLKAAGSVRDGLPIAMLSYPWLSPSHPDPRRDTLLTLARVLAAFIDNVGYGVAERRRWGVFWDFASLHQHPPEDVGGSRTMEEDALFKQGLEGLGRFYSHPRTTVFRMTRMPENWPQDYNLPKNANVADYINRGWCYTEQCWASLTKDYDFSLDLGRLPPLVLSGSPTRSARMSTKREIIEACTKGGGRRPPLTPEQFDEEVSKRAFTNGKDDKPLVQKLYKDECASRLGSASSITYASLGWGDVEALQLADVLASGATPQLAVFDLHDNKFHDKGIKALAAAFATPDVLPNLESLDLRSCRIGEAGMKAIAEAITAGALPKLRHCFLGGNPGTQHSVVAALKRRHHQNGTLRPMSSPRGTTGLRPRPLSEEWRTRNVAAGRSATVKRRWVRAVKGVIRGDCARLSNEL